MAVFASDESHQQAAVRFLKWFTEPEQNIRFAVATGYLPVQEKALESVSDLVSHVESRDNVQAVEQSIGTSLTALKITMYMSGKPLGGLTIWTRYFPHPWRTV